MTEVDRNNFIRKKLETYLEQLGKKCLCEAVYPTEYWENSTTVSFTLPTANALSYGGVYYCRVRSYI